METREKIIQQAGELFMKYGVRRVTMDEIARGLAVSKKTLYQYFKDKDEITANLRSGSLLMVISRAETWLIYL